MKKHVRKEIKDLTFEVSNLSIHLLKKMFPIKDLAFMTSTQKGDEEVLKSVMYLQIRLFLNNRTTVNFCGWGWVCWDGLRTS